MSPTLFSIETHEQIENHLLAYINCRLSSLQQRQVQAHTNQCSDCFGLLRREQLIRQQLVDTPPELQCLLSDRRAAQAFEELLSELEIQENYWRNKAGKVKRCIELSVARLPLVAAFCGIVFVLLVTVWLRLQLDHPGIEWRGSSSSMPFDSDSIGEQGGSMAIVPGSKSYRIIFKSSVGEDDIRAILLPFETQLENGTSGNGVYIMSVPALVNKQEGIVDIPSDNTENKRMATDVN